MHRCLYSLVLIISGLQSYGSWKQINLLLIIPHDIGRQAYFLSYNAQNPKYCERGEKELWIFAWTSFSPISLMIYDVYRNICSNLCRLLLLYFIISSKSYNSFAEASKFSVFDHRRIIQNSNFTDLSTGWAVLIVYCHKFCTCSGIQLAGKTAETRLSSILSILHIKSGVIVSIWNYNDSPLFFHLCCCVVFFVIFQGGSVTCGFSEDKVQ